MAAGDTGAINPEVIGGVAISIGGDYSTLAAAFATATGLAQTAGTNIAAALSAGGAAGADLGDEIAQGLEPITPAAGDATDAVSALSDSLDGAISPASDLSDATASAAESITGAGDASDEAAGSIGDLASSADEAASSTDDLDASAGDAADSVGELGDQASEAADSAGELNDELPDAAGSAGELGDSAHEAGSALEQMAEQMVALGEALVITEGLKEFGSEALAAADAITTAKIALTNMTGSAQEAGDQIEALEKLGMQDGLAMPSLLTAAQRMTQLLPPGTDVTTLLGQIADGAAAMGGSIDQASTRFAQIADQGTLSARSLSSLGLSLTSVATAMNQVNPSADATAATVTTMFKAMDPGTRITVLETALSSLGGTAQTVANQTFGGQWQQLANAWESIMAQVGAILPVITDLIDFTKTDIIPFVQSAVSAFTSLPGPVKDVAVAGGLLLASIIPLSGAISAASLAVSGLGGVIPAVSGVMSTLGLTSTATAAAETTEAAATAAVGAAAVAAVPEITAETVATQASGVAATEAALQYDLFAHSALTAEWSAGAEQLSLFGAAAEDAGIAGAAASTAVGGLSIAAAGVGVALTAGVIGVTAYGVGWQRVGDDISTFTSVLQEANQQVAGGSTKLANAATNTDLFRTALIPAAAAVGLLGTGLKNLGQGFAEAGELGTAILEWLTGIPPQAALMGNSLATNMNRVQTSATTAEDSVRLFAASVAAANGTAQVGLGMDADLVTALKNIMSSAHDAAGAYQTAKQAYDAMVQSQQTGNPILGIAAATAQDVAKAYKDMQSAASAAGITLAPIPGSMDAINAAATKMASATNFVVDATDEQNNEQAAAVSSLDLTHTAYDTSIAKLDLLKSQLKDANDAYTAGTGPRSAVLTAEQNLAVAYNTSQSDLDKFKGTLQNYITYMNGSGASTQAQIDLLKDLADQYGPVTAKSLGLTSQIQALQDKLGQVQTIAGNMGAITGLASAYQEASDKVADLSAKMAAGENVGQQYEQALTKQLNALVALNAANAEEATGLQGATDAMSLATIAVAAAQAKYDTLKQAYQDNITLAPQVAAAQNALTTAQNALNKAIGDGSPLIVAQGTAMNTLTYANGQLVPAVGSATNAINSQTAALQQDATALQSVAAAVAQVEADMSSAIGAANGSKGISGGGAGTVVRSTGLGYFGQEEYSVTQVPNLTQAQFDGLVDKYGLAFAKGVEANYNAIGYSDNYSPTTVTAATSGSTGAASSTTSGLTTDQSPIIVSSLPGGSTTTGTTSTTAASASPVTTTTSAGTSAVDGGSYPAVTAHQAAGEIWAVSASGAGATGGAVGTGSTADLTTAISAAVGSTAQTSANAISTAAGSIGGAADQIATFSGGLLPISSALTATAAATAQVASDIGGILLHLTTTSGGGLNPIATSGTSPTAGTISTVASGTIQTYYGSGNPQGPTVPLPPTQNPTTGPGANAVTVQANFDLRGANLGGTPSAQVQQKLTQAVTNGMVQALFTSGARLTRYAP